MTFERKTYNVEEAAKVIGISRPKMYNLCHAQGFPAIFIGKRIIIPCEGLHRWLEAEASKNTAAHS